MERHYSEGQFAIFLNGQMTAGSSEVLLTSSNEENVYTRSTSGTATGPQFNGIKFGSSSANGTVTLNFAPGTNVNRIVAGCAGWAAADTLTIGGVTKTPTQNGAAATVEDMEFTFGATDTITIVTTKRVIFNYISVYHMA